MGSGARRMYGKNMKVQTTGIEGLLVVELDIHRDGRGFFVERFNAKQFAEHGLPTAFLQDNHSRSSPKVLRGLHMQYDPPMGKLVGVLHGCIYDVAVDVRPNSKTFGKYFGLELSGDNGKLLWIPAGFAHGFCVVGDESADVFYKVDALYNAPGEIGIRWDDTEIGIKWPVENPLVSERDKKLPSFASYKENPPQW